MLQCIQKSTVISVNLHFSQNLTSKILTSKNIAEQDVMCSFTFGIESIAPESHGPVFFTCAFCFRVKLIHKLSTDLSTIFCG